MRLRKVGRKCGGTSGRNDECKGKTIRRERGRQETKGDGMGEGKEEWGGRRRRCESRGKKGEDEKGVVEGRRGRKRREARKDQGGKERQMVQDRKRNTWYGICGGKRKDDDEEEKNRDEKGDAKIDGRGKEAGGRGERGEGEKNMWCGMCGGKGK